MTDKNGYQIAGDDGTVVPVKIVLWNLMTREHKAMKKLLEDIVQNTADFDKPLTLQQMAFKLEVIHQRNTALLGKLGKANPSEGITG